MEEQGSSEARYLELIPKLRLMDDDFLKVCMQDNKPGVQLILRIVLRNKGLVVTRVVTQREMKNLVGHSLELDVYAEDEEGKHINAEIQRNPELAERARYFKEDSEGVKAMCKIMEDIKNEGRESMLTDMVVSLLKRGKSPAFIADTLEIAKEKVMSIAEANNIAIV